MRVGDGTRVARGVRRVRRVARSAVVGGFLVAMPGCVNSSPPDDLLSAGDVVAAAADAPAPDSIIPYGDHPLQFGKLRLPPESVRDRESGLVPVVAFIHGGCWLAEYDIGHVAPLEQALADAGYAVWSLEYRRVGDEDGGWPNTFLDVGAGLDYLRVIAQRHRLDLGRLVVSGHSAGGQLAIWAAGRPKLRRGDELWRPDPIEMTGVLALAPAADMEGLAPGAKCDDAVRRVMGGLPAEVPGRYEQASPMALAPISVPQTLVLGRWDDWTPAGRAYADHAEIVEMSEGTGRAWVEVVDARESGHFEMIMPGTSTWDLVLVALEGLLD